jgi:hypothetical protein
MFESCKRLPLVGEVEPENKYSEPMPVSMELIDPSVFIKLKNLAHVQMLGIKLSLLSNIVEEFTN